ncbi:MAG: hypothetical protein JWM69_140 [Candidatus Binatus sp.]|nr:hypothetical protein [Candidatus Binatus sp.]
MASYLTEFFGNRLSAFVRNKLTRRDALAASIFAGLAIVAVRILLIASPAHAQNSSHPTDRIVGVPMLADSAARTDFNQMVVHVKSLKAVMTRRLIHHPLAGRVGASDIDAEDRYAPAMVTTIHTDGGRQSATARNFIAGRDTGTVTPPDTQGAVGPNHLMVTLNNNVTIQSRAGAVIRTVPIAGFWSSLGAISEAFDPRVLFDPYAGRWIMSSGADAGASSAAILIGVSQTSDPTAGWNLYQVKVDPAGQNWADYPTLGFNGDWIVVQSNIFTVNQGAYLGSYIYVFNKADLYAGGVGQYTLLKDSTGYTDYPAVTYDNTLPVEYLLRDWNGSAGTLRISEISGPVRAEVLTTGIAYPGTANHWQDWAPTTNFAPQLGTIARIDTDDSRIENCIFRNGSLWVAHTVYLPAGGPTRSAAQWWQINTASGSLGVVQQLGRVDDPNGSFDFAFPTVAVNANSDMMIGYSRFGASQYASANYSFRRHGDPAGALGPDTVIKAGEGPYFKDFGTGDNRWGDYINTLVDPLNDLDMWTIQEYAASGNNWGTWWASIALTPSPTATATRTATLTPTPTARPTRTPRPRRTPKPARTATPTWIPSTKPTPTATGHRSS